MSSNSNSKYTKDNVFDSFNLKEVLQNDVLIPKISSQFFVYSNDLKALQSNSSKQLSLAKIGNNEEDIYQQINNNHFDIIIEELLIRDQYGYPDTFLNHYTPVKFIGQGAFGLVLSVIKKATNQQFAVKIIKKTHHQDNCASLGKEGDFLKKFDNHRILKFHEVIETESYYFLFVDLIEGGTLKELIIERYKDQENDYLFKDSEVALIMRGILEGVDYLHKMNIMHRDIKPENIMFKRKGDLKSLLICDLGIADEINTLRRNDQCGTWLFMAPEMIDQRPYDHLVDLWSCGIVQYIMESGGKHPIFLRGMNKKDYANALKEKKELYFPPCFSDLARNFFLKLCKFEPFYRYQTNKALKHPWITRDISGTIPLTLVEGYEREDKIKTFKNMLLCSLFCKCYQLVNIHKFSVIKSPPTIVNTSKPFPLDNNSSPIKIRLRTMSKRSSCLLTPLKPRSLINRQPTPLTMIRVNDRTNTKSNNDFISLHQPTLKMLRFSSQKNLFFKENVNNSNKNDFLKPLIDTKETLLNIANMDHNSHNRLLKEQTFTLEQKQKKIILKHNMMNLSCIHGSNKKLTYRKSSMG